MGLPRYVINFDEAVGWVRDAINQGFLSKAVPIDLNDIKNANMDFGDIELMLQTIIDTNIVVNDKTKALNEALPKFWEYLYETRPEFKEEFEKTNEMLNEVLRLHKVIKEDLKTILKNLSGLGIQKMKGYYDYIPPVRGDYKIVNTVDKDIYLTAITFSQIGWKLEDAISLVIEDEPIFKNIGTKEIAEKKAFTKKMFLEANTPVEFVLHNRSGNSRQLWVDFEYIEVEGTV
jgi:hypothetical protein